MAADIRSIFKSTSIIKQLLNESSSGSVILEH